MAITLDLLLHAGVLVERDSSKWVLSDNYLECRMHLVGDGNTVENMVVFFQDMQDRRITYSNASIMFLKALSVVMTFLGDWHAGLNMAQTVFNYYYTGFLDEFHSCCYNGRELTRMLVLVFSRCPIDNFCPR